MNSIIENISLVTKMLGAPIASEVLWSQIERKADKSIDLSSLKEILKLHGLDNQLIKRDIIDIPSLATPFVILLKNDESVVVNRIEGKKTSRQYEVILSGGLKKIITYNDLVTNYLGYCWFIKKTVNPESRSELPEYHLPKRWFWKIIGRFKKYYYQVIIASFVINTLALISSLYVMNVYDRVIPNQAYETLWVLSIGVILAIIFEFIAKMLRAYLLDIAGKKADMLISSALFRRVMLLRFDKKPTSSGSYANNLKDFEAIRDFMTSASLLAVVDLPFIFLFIFVISLIGGYLAFVPLTILPIVVIVGLLIQKPLARSIQSSMKESSQRQGLAVEAIEGIETLKVNNATTWAQQRWEMFTARTSLTSIKVRNLTNFMINFSAALQQLNTVALVFVGTYLIHSDDVNSRITMGALIASVILSGRALAPLGQIASLATRFQSAKMALAGVNAIISRPIERNSERKYITPEKIQGAIELSNISYQYDKDSPAALKELNLIIKPGEKVAILGKIGSGKSTLLKLLTGLYEQSQGNITLDNLDIRQIDPIYLRNKVALLSQSPRLFYGSLRENLDLARIDSYSSDDELITALSAFGLDKLIRQHPAGLDMPLGEDGLGLSGGQKQIIALVQLMLRKPRVVLLDEPTTGLDKETEKQALNTLGQWTKDKTLIVVTHKYQILDIVDRIIVMDDGKIILDGPKKQVLDKLLAQEKPAHSVAKVPRSNVTTRIQVISNISHQKPQPEVGDK
ncbi:type I secretion system permease/ATPase [Moellerella wisconsensis]|uniref:type I secretion system permease/ATPase n=1 Tax=Moellerella wisconsensis TaxID=158849 RepID=UPI001F4E70D6|nr:type I secretion system permease/ATPase [Moellerella wisconsensis]UNH25176.1 type I secretion system permease/ATPase [Moellerella wisconsensis]